MAASELSQSEADALTAMPKVREDDTAWRYPELGGAISLPLLSEDHRERFLLDVSRGRIELARERFQNRARQVVILVRLDVGGPMHRNPDGTEIPCPHIHLYREGYGDKWAFPVPTEHFATLDDQWQTYLDFLAFCNVTEPPNIDRGLFA